MGFSRMRLITTHCSQTRICTTYTAITQAATLAAPKICLLPTPRDWTLFCIHTLLLRVVSAFNLMGLFSFYSLPLQKKYVHGVSDCGILSASLALYMLYQEVLRFVLLFLRVCCSFFALSLERFTHLRSPLKLRDGAFYCEFEK